MIIIILIIILIIIILQLLYGLKLSRSWAEASFSRRSWLKPLGLGFGGFGRI